MAIVKENTESTATDKIFLYHLTSSHRLFSIHKEGLIPHNGPHCKRIKDRSSDIVFLCKKEDILFWYKCFRDVDVVIEIDCSSFRPDLRRRYAEYAPTKAEYGCVTSISPDYFSREIFLSKHEVKNLKD